jgi:hypothetical protein
VCRFSNLGYTLRLCAVASPSSVLMRCPYVYSVRIFPVFMLKLKVLVRALKRKINADPCTPYLPVFQKKMTSHSSWKPVTSQSSTAASEFWHCDIRQYLFHDDVTVSVLVSPVSLRRAVSRVSVLATWCFDPSFLTLHLHQQRGSLEFSYKHSASTNSLTPEQNATKSLYVRYT